MRWLAIDSHGAYHRNPCLEIYPVLDPEWFGDQLLTLVKYDVCRAEIFRVVLASRLVDDQRSSWGIPLIPPSQTEYRTTPNPE